MCGCDCYPVKDKVNTGGRERCLDKTQTGVREALPPRTMTETSDLKPPPKPIDKGKGTNRIIEQLFRAEC